MGSERGADEAGPAGDENPSRHGLQ
jgi:hypothetical protein